MVNKIMFSLLEGLFPHQCRLCGLRSYREVPLCRPCQSDLSRNKQHCSRCALPLATNNPDSTLCGRCLQAQPAFDHVVAPWIYEEQMGFLIQRWKFHRERGLTPLLTHLWLDQFTGQSTPPDLIVPVPLHWLKLWQRGFNQSELFALELRRQWPQLKTAKLGTRWVRRHRATTAQSGLASKQRNFNLLGAFTARRRCDNLRVAIIDDVLTTGATAAAMAVTLRDAGASHIEVWCIARTP